ncbi:MAG: hypothetical protein C4B59_12555 [Candidatus Methanogaster sp.]|uniref:Uncharacterized protein n=1 Tax=Candidatus Methanogaster sp. TaxID=3386292 RepID=A0AC61L0N8_9EURY|nr:MAG: hypothetical protein C4B59_12555 [ANME-2 cluster archaeon]
MMPKNIELHIEELVLHGFSPGDRYRIGEAVEQELSRMLADRGVPESLALGGEIASVDGGAFEVATGSDAGVVGAQVAKAVYGGLRQ